MNPYLLACRDLHDPRMAADQGRDPLFLLLMGSMSALLGPDGYESFRIVLAAYFAVFTYWLLRGRHVPADGRRHRWPLLLLGLLPFVAPRFTIQIREGLALTLVLVGLVLLTRPSSATVATVAAGSTPRAALPRPCPRC